MEIHVLNILTEEKNRPCLYFWLRLAPLKTDQWGSTSLLNHCIMRASVSDPEADLRLCPEVWGAGGL